VRGKIRTAATVGGFVWFEGLNCILPLLNGRKRDVVFYNFFLYIILVKNKFLIDLIYLLFCLFDLYLQAWIRFLLQSQLCLLHFHLKVIDSFGKIDRFVKIFNGCDLNDFAKLTHECFNAILSNFGRGIDDLYHCIAFQLDLFANFFRELVAPFEPEKIKDDENEDADHV
jgi:hypothetical protein